MSASQQRSVLVYSTRRYEHDSLIDTLSASGYDVHTTEAPLDARTALAAHDIPAVCLFTNDDANRCVLDILARGGTRFIALRCAGFNNVDLDAARRLGIQVARVPEYSPYAVAEHTVGLLLTLNRKLHRAYARVREQNFALDGLLGFDLHGKTVGIVGMGKIGCAFARIMLGFGCEVLFHDPAPREDALHLATEQVDLDALLSRSDVISLHCPLTPTTHHLINAEHLARCKSGVFLLNTGRGALIDTPALIQAIKSGHVGAVGLDVYEQESGVFFSDHSGDILNDDVLARLMTFPNVFITGHQGFFTREALQSIANTTKANLDAFFAGQSAPSWVT